MLLLSMLTMLRNVAANVYVTVTLMLMLWLMLMLMLDVC